MSSVDIQQIFKQASSKTTKPNPKVRNVAQVSHTKKFHPRKGSVLRVNQFLFKNMVTSVSKLEKHIPDWDTNPYSHDAKAQRWKHITCIGKRSKFVTHEKSFCYPKRNNFVTQTVWVINGLGQTIIILLPKNPFTIM